MNEPSTLGRRLKEARLATALRVGRTLSQAAMADMVGKELGVDVWQQAWSGYEADKSEPPLAIIRATAKLSGLDPSYLAFGAPSAPAGLTLEEAIATARPMPRPAPAPAVARKKGRGGR